MNEPQYDPAYDPVDHLARMGVELELRPLKKHAALWVPEERKVLLDPKVPAHVVRPVLGHECSHAENEDPGGHHPRNEARANLHSALRITNPDEWAALIASLADYDRICLELGLTRGQFIAYSEWREAQDRQPKRRTRTTCGLLVA
ncbi:MULTISPECIES: hypothetical protein [Bacteria]|uniref:hypothetical protein n=1 Tax=Bacteria TaxID=2 RepID=UPI0006215286|nr:hypothetical protein [Leucobacter sp. Ag1]KKI20584.1 hypothetical protein XM48_07670 [Leucobacter sp. Ag1]